MNPEKNFPSPESEKRPIDHERNESNIQVLEERILGIRQRLANLSGDENAFRLEEGAKRSRFPLTKAGLEEALHMAERSLKCLKQRRSEYE